MARTIPGWERLKPSKSETGKPGWRMLSHDCEAQQVAIYRKNEGPWTDASIYCEWRSRDKRWRFFMLDAQDRPQGPIYHEHFEPAMHAFNDHLVDRDLPPIV